jgi:hypothetical protein
VATRRHDGGFAWTLVAVGVLVLGLGVRLAIGGSGVGDRSALVMVCLFSVGAWLTARVLSGTRVACFVTLAVVALLDLAALPARNPAEYDGVQAFDRTDQVLATQVPVPAGFGSGGTLMLLVQPVFAGAQPSFELAGQVNGTPLSWRCAWERRIARVALPVPAAVAVGGASADVRLYLRGAPGRETDYVLVYTSSRRGGFVLSLEGPGADAADSEATHCTLA